MSTKKKTLPPVPSVSNWIIDDIKANVVKDGEFPSSVTRAILLNDLAAACKIIDVTTSMQDVLDAVIYLRNWVPSGIVNRWREKLEPMREKIEWHYIDDEMPDEKVTVLVAFHASGQPAGAFLQDGVWRYDNGGDEIRSVYAWADFPAIPPAKKGSK